MDKHEHRYAKLNDGAVFCRGCGDIKNAEPPVCTLPHYQPMWVYYPPTYTQPSPTYYPWWRLTTGAASGYAETITFDSASSADTTRLIG